MNNNRSDERAIQAGCKGVFSTTSYITVGNKGKPEEYGRAMKDHSRYGGKQIGTNWPKLGKTIDTYFQKEHKWVYSGCKFNDRLLYATQQQAKSKGFLTSDFSRSAANKDHVKATVTLVKRLPCSHGDAMGVLVILKDEFSMDFRTNQYREQLKMENKYAKRALELLKSAGGDSEPVEAHGMTFELQEGVDKPFLYDLVFEKEDAAHSGSSKVSRDTKNPTTLTKDRKFGDMRTSMLMAHGPPDASCFTKPQFARKPVVQDTFFRKTNIAFPDGCAAVNTGNA